MSTYVVVGCFILFDIVTGIMKALYNGGINSTLLRVGLFHKLSEVLAVVGSGLLEYGADYLQIGTEYPVLAIVSTYVILMELISILENICEVNPTLGKLFKPYLEKLKNKKGKDE